MSARAGRHRLKREELVMAVLSLLSEEFERSEAESMWQIALPASTIRKHLSERHGTAYSSDHWLHTQLRRYEDEIGVPLFERTSQTNTGKEKTFALGLHQPMTDFYQKQHLYVTEKIKIANGVYDFIKDYARRLGKERACNVLLGAGSTVYHMATIFAEGSHSAPERYHLFTHNAGFFQKLLNSNVNYDRLTVSTLGGTLEPTTRTILGTRLDELGGTELDIVVQGTSNICNGRLYVESERERVVKAAILNECSGCKILVCTKHEFSERPLTETMSYGWLTDYDYLVVPHSPGNAASRAKQYELEFQRHEPYLEPQVLNWNYAIFRIVKR